MYYFTKHETLIINKNSITLSHFCTLPGKTVGTKSLLKYFFISCLFLMTLSSVYTYSCCSKVDILRYDFLIKSEEKTVNHYKMKTFNVLFLTAAVYREI